MESINTIIIYLQHVYRNNHVFIYAHNVRGYVHIFT